MKTKSIGVLMAILLVLASVGYNFSPAWAAGFPEKQINLYIGMAPGGATDVAVRTLVEESNQYLEHPIIVVNKPGGGGAIATDFVVKAKPDGYSVNWTTLATVIQTVVDRNNPFQMKDLTPVVRAYQMGMVVAVRSDSMYNNLNDLAKFAKAKPDTISCGTPGMKSVWNFAREIFSKEAGIKLRHVPFKSDTEIITALLGKHIEVGFLGAPAVAEHIKGGSLRGLAITFSQRATNMPNVPTMAEEGYAKAGVVTWGAVQGPAGMPNDAVQKISAAFKKALESPKVIKAFDTQGLLPYFMGPVELKSFIAEEIKRIDEVAKAAQIGS